MGRKRTTAKVTFGARNDKATVVLEIDVVTAEGVEVGTELPLSRAQRDNLWHVLTVARSWDVPDEMPKIGGHR